MPDNRFVLVCNYRYSFNGMEKDDEISGNGNSLTTPFRMYNPRLGRWMSTDPITHAMYSPYSAFDNNPIYYSDPSGADSKTNGDTDPPKEINGKEGETAASGGTFAKNGAVVGGTGYVAQDIDVTVTRKTAGYTALSDKTNLDISVNINPSTGTGASEDPRAFSWLYSLGNATGTSDPTADYFRSLSNPNYKQKYGAYFTSKDGEGKPNGAENVFGAGGNIDESQKMIKNLNGIVKNEPIEFGGNLNNLVNGAKHLVGSQKKADNINSEFDNYNPIFSKTTSEDIERKNRDTIVRIFIREDTLKTGGISGFYLTDTITVDSLKRLDKGYGGDLYR